MPTKTVDPVVERLRAVAESSLDLKEMAQVYEIVLPILRDADLRAEPISITPEQARIKLENGLPLLHDIDLAFDDDAARALLVRLARALETLHREARTTRRLPWSSSAKPDAATLYEHARAGDDAILRGVAARQIRLTLERGELQIGTLLSRVAAGDRAYVTSLAQSHQLDPSLLWTLGQNTLKPALRAWCRQLVSFAQGIDWQRGYCFVCGAGATLAELQDNAQGKHLRCGQCGADWTFPRLQCMFCGNNDHATLSYFYPDGQREKLCIEVCDKCGGYLKVVTSFSAMPPEMLPVEDLATLHLDFVAQARGYARVAFQ